MEVGGSSPLTLHRQSPWLAGLDLALFLRAPLSGCVEVLPSEPETRRPNATAHMHQFPTAQ